MSRWKRGEAVVERFLGSGELQRIQGVATNGTAWLDKSRRTIETAADIVAKDPDSAFVLAYDAARMACVGLLAQQGLRPTTRGGHLVVDEAVRAQFGDRFQPIRPLRIRRNELEYPALPGDTADHDEALAAIAEARAIISSADALLEHLGFF